MTTKPGVFFAAAWFCGFSPICLAKPLKVFILAGQSNMEGHAEVRTFDYIGKDPLTAPLLKEMRNPDGTPRVCDKVWMSYLTGPYDGSANGEGLGKLTAGFGARGDQPTKDGGKIGPEFTFGIYMEKELKDPILIIKTAWGGRSLNTEFRPPISCRRRFKNCGINIRRGPTEFPNLRTGKSGRMRRMPPRESFTA
jgi:alpha-galactosidase